MTRKNVITVPEEIIQNEQRRNEMSFFKARGAGYGLDAEIAAKLSLKFDPVRAAAAINWLAELAGCLLSAPK